LQNPQFDLIIRPINIELKRQQRNTREIKRSAQREITTFGVVNCPSVTALARSPRASIITTIIAAIYRDRKYSSGLPTAKIPISNSWI